VHCGESEPSCLCLHHVNKDEKEGAIDKIIQRGRLIHIFIEIAKCVVMCHNCHARLHADLIVLPEGISNAVFYVVKYEPLVGHTKIIHNPLADYGQLELDIV